LPALLAALELPGCDGLEFDVRSARDGTPVLLHDPTLLRVQHRAARVDRLDPPELARHGIPTLADALAAIGPEPFLDVELKGDPGPQVVEVLDAGRGPELANAVVTSFEEATLARVLAARPGWPCWLNADDLSAATVASAVALGCRGVAARSDGIDAAAMERARVAGLEVAAWTVRDPREFERVAALGVMAVCVEGAALDG
jgi:glycerophosphoryl diester phosphodiesterase